LLGVLVVLALLAVVVDRAACWFTQSAAADRFQSSQQLSAKPTIRIGGFPFLTQLAARRFDDVTVKASGLVVGDASRKVRIASLTARLKGLTVARDLSSATARSGTGHAIISYPDLSKAAGIAVSWAGKTGGSSGRVKASKTVTAAGQSFTGSVSAVPVVASGNAIRFEDPQVDLGNVGVPQWITDQFAGVLPPLSLSGLPNGLTLRSVLAGPDGVAIVLSLVNVTLR
jgi:hypothetical protein